MEAGFYRVNRRFDAAAEERKGLGVALGAAGGKAGLAGRGKAGG